ncbi:ClpXP protease specificity-enhancing factor [Comamonas serinivorans]|uniref:ClpXP protease specificity-enhancing factor n=1 Tax=Comamonas serinivorans TaxID=1082851 RepID=A0A1Y0ETC2_9BURK|nr:ClpXP protease specificity-enhancing factor [Comamonas serinivorans]ARU06917.1 ClpXP protease specificity-enhancing factor [Comamonas serinivorans]
MDPSQPTSTRPYLLRALYEWCGDNGLTPHVAVAVDDTVVVPHEFVKDGEIVLNISQDAAHGLRIDNDAVTFKARFSGVARDIYVPVGRVIALFARENGQGMGFPPEDTPVYEGDDAADAKPAMQLVTSTEEQAPEASGSDTRTDGTGEAEPADPDPKPGGGKPTLRRIK